MAGERGVAPPRQASCLRAQRLGPSTMERSRGSGAGGAGESRWSPILCRPGSRGSFSRSKNWSRSFTPPAAAWSKDGEDTPAVRQPLHAAAVDPRNTVDRPPVERNSFSEARARRVKATSRSAGGLRRRARTAKGARPPRRDADAIPVSCRAARPVGGRRRASLEERGPRDGVSLGRASQSYDAGRGSSVGQGADRSE